MSRTPLTLNKPWEASVPFSLGVISTGRLLHTAGITARDADGQVLGIGDMRRQVQQCFANLGDVLAAAGADWSQVIRYMLYTTDIDRFDAETRDLRWPFFVDRPASTLVEVRRLLRPEMLVEIEAVVALDAPRKSR